VAKHSLFPLLADLRPLELLDGERLRVDFLDVYEPVGLDSFVDVVELLPEQLDASLGLLGLSGLLVRLDFLFRPGLLELLELRQVLLVDLALQGLNGGRLAAVSVTD
jgi:hypothetical protein